MWLNQLWFVLYVVIIAGYVILDGFDLGVGMLSPIIGRSDHDKRVLLNSIGPVWDGNEVWLVLGGGALFAAFPFVYASLFSGFYLALMAVLLVLIMRAVAIEFRSKRPSARWRSTWDWFFTISSAGIAFLLGVALGNILRGVPIDDQGNLTVDFFGLLSPYALLLGVASVLMLALHGGIYLTMKLSDELLERVERLVPRLMAAFFVVMTAVIVWTLFLPEDFAQNFRDRPWTAVFPAAAFVAVLVAWRSIAAGAHGRAFVASATMIGLLMASVAAALYPVMLPASNDAANSLTIYNAASEQATLTVMLVVAVVGMPFVLLYTAGVYYFFRGRVQLDEDSY
ncbi:MAG: cytochrome d ubiquinol oxidase subunit II [Actinobacteria bacterium]|nr:cytochrome d ubiquinol oxidase subunit II [Actinomycetota bacterium]